MAKIQQESSLVNPVGTGFTATADFSGPEWQTETPVSRRVFEHKSGKQISAMRFGDSSKKDDWYWANRILPQVVTAVVKALTDSCAKRVSPPFVQVVSAFTVTFDAATWRHLHPMLTAYARRHPELVWFRSPRKDGSIDLVLPGWCLRWFKWATGAPRNFLIYKTGKEVKALVNRVLEDHDRTKRMSASQGIRLRDPRKRIAEWREIGHTDLEPEEIVEVAEKMGYATSYWVEQPGHAMAIVRLPEDAGKRDELFRALRIRLLVTA